MGGYIGSPGERRNMACARLPAKGALLYARAIKPCRGEACLAPPVELEGDLLSVDAKTVRRIAHLARIAVAEEEIEPLQDELNAILAFVEQLSQVDVENVEPMTSVIPMEMKKREDKVTDGEISDDIIRNAPVTEDHFFLVPKVLE
jgi:aspartyl-tRNA(Asn)/glutamyl-tRNA(Gln) amidotransferase subunit C